MKTTVYCTFLLLSAFAADAGQPRTWTDNTGRTCQAELVAFRHGAVSLRTTDGQTYEVAVSRLSKADQQYLGEAVDGDEAIPRQRARKLLNEAVGLTYGSRPPRGWEVVRLDNEGHHLQRRDLAITGDFDLSFNLQIRKQRGAAEVVLLGAAGHPDVRLSFYLRSPFSNGANWTITTPKGYVHKPVPWGTRRFRLECRGDFFRLICDSTLENRGKANVVVSQFVVPHPKGFTGIEIGVNDVAAAVERIEIVSCPTSGDRQIVATHGPRVAAGKSQQDLPKANVGGSFEVTAEQPAGEDAASIIDQAIAFYEGTNGQQDETKAKQLFDAAFEVGGPVATMWTARLLYKGRCGFEKNKLRAEGLAKSVLEEIAQQAASGEVHAMFLYASALEDGLAIDANATGAIHWYEKAANLGCANSMYNVHLLHAAEGNTEASMRWLRRAVEANHVLAAVVLADCYRDGKNVARDSGKAVSLYEKAIGAGSIIAMNDLGQLYEKESEPDYEKAQQWYRRAAESGYTYGMVNLARMYEHGWGVGKDLDKAREWIRKAAAGGHEDAQRVVRSWDQENRTARSYAGGGYYGGSPMRSTPAEEAERAMRRLREQYSRTLTPGLYFTPGGGSGYINPNGNSYFVPGHGY